MRAIFSSFFLPIFTIKWIPLQRVVIEIARIEKYNIICKYSVGTAAVWSHSDAVCKRKHHSGATLLAVFKVAGRKRKGKIKNRKWRAQIRKKKMKNELRKFLKPSFIRRD